MKIPQTYRYLILVGLLVVASAVSVWALTQKDPEAEIIPISDTARTLAPAPIQTQEPVSAEPEYTKFSEEEKYADAGRFTNQRFKYSFAYPAGTTIAGLYPASMVQEDFDAGVTFTALRNKYGTDLCVMVGLPSGGNVSISAKANHDGQYVACSRTGVGAADLTEVSETVDIAGKTYTARGMKIDASKEEGYISYEYSQALPDKTMVYFSWGIDEKHPAATVPEQKQEVFNTLKSLSFE